MKLKIVAYWICTVLVAFSFVSGGITQLMRAPQAVEGFTKLGYPVYFLIILGVWKLLGGIVILIPGFPLVKEWAYAGIVFDLTGASASYLATHGEIWHMVTPLIITALAVASWALRPEGRRLKLA
jgi:uncharacterized membrane protein YphA (DoxX/SURF4 family)